MRLTELTDQPQLLVTIDGQEYGFSELPIAHKARLQAYLEQKIPHPLEAVKPHLIGLDPEDRRYLLNEARKEAEDWPPDIESSKGKLALLAKQGGQMEALFVGLTVHQPETTREQAERLFRNLERETAVAILTARNEKREFDGESTIKRVYACIFGFVLASDLEGLPRLKADTSKPNSPSTGPYSSAYLSSA